MRRLRWLVPILVVLGVIAYAGLWVWGGVNRSASSILRHGTRVEVFRVDPKPGEDRADAVGGYPILAVGREQGPEFAARLSEVLRRWGVSRSSKKCGLMAGVAFRVWDGDRAVEVLICFKCDDLKVHVVGDDDSDEGLLAFDSERRDLLALAKEALPDDPDIRALPDIRPREWTPDPPVKTKPGSGTTTTETAVTPGPRPNGSEEK
jgi:hypothetical protein